MRTLLIANRGEIAVRIAASARRLGLKVVAIYSDVDVDAPHVRTADAAIRVGEAAPGLSYLNIEAILEAARLGNADAIHPGYGFLAENADFADAVAAAGLTFIGPAGAAMRALASKSAAKAAAQAVGLPVLPGYSGDTGNDDDLARAAIQVGFPLMIKAAAGGGGRGMRVVEDGDDLGLAIRAARAEALGAFGSDELLLERAVRGARHVEVQVFCDGAGRAVFLGDRDCSVQRRHQKVIEEAPAPNLPQAQRLRMGRLSCALAASVGYIGAGTVEFLVEPNGEFWFLEMNTRLQVEHGVTEAIFGVDLVEWQLRVARGEPLPLTQDQLRASGHAMEVRLCAEDPEAGFLPQAGRVQALVWPQNARVDHALEPGLEVSPYYDSMLAKIITWGPDREEALGRLDAALASTRLLGLATNRAFLRSCLDDPAFRGARIDTQFLQARNLGPSAGEIDQAWSLAAIAIVLAESKATPALLQGWSNAPWRRPGVRLSHGEREAWLELRQDGPQWQVRLGDHVRRFKLDVFSSQDLVGLLDGERVAARFRRDGDLIEIETGRVRRILRDDTRTGRPRAEDLRAQIVTAPMAGRVSQVLVALGQTVTRGQPILLLEAMKMEHRLESRLDGVVTALEVAEGEQVAHSARLAQIEAADG